jgi:hypothetical protein
LTNLPANMILIPSTAARRHWRAAPSVAGPDARQFRGGRPAQPCRHHVDARQVNADSVSQINLDPSSITVTLE